MKKIFCFLTAVAVSVTAMRADEGMWLLPLLQKMNGKALKEAGCKLTPDQIYSINHSSLKDAIVQFGGGCTGEIISKDGLLVTNHHCGYGSIQRLSSVEHNYLADGYWAMNHSEELPVKGLTVTFLEYMEDVTPIINKAIDKYLKENEGFSTQKIIKLAIDDTTRGIIAERENDFPYCDLEVESFYDNNVFYFIAYKTYRDVRFVGAPPSSIGKFGADTDNWMWPRHTCDFSMFRVYADEENNPADYSEKNIPYTPKQHLKISLKGVQEGDYTMIMGYPGTTTRFQTSPELQFQIDINDIRIAARTIRQNIMLEDMLADPKVKIQYASKYSGSSNGWKKWQGMKLAFKKLNIIGRAEKDETAFTKWINSNKKRAEKYGSSIEYIKGIVESMRAVYPTYTVLSESVARIEILSAYATLLRAMDDIEDGEDTTAIVTRRLEGFYKDYSVDTDRKIAKAMLKFYRDNVDPEYYLEIPEDFETLDIDAYVDSLFNTSVLTSLDKVSEALKAGSLKDILGNDPVMLPFNAVNSRIYGFYSSVASCRRELRDVRRTYTAGLMEWKKGRPSYPDANFTMRLTYGHVLPYSPKDAVLYRHFTTLDGVMEKEDPDNWEFVVPAKLKELWEAKDFGQYAMADGRMPACFLSNNDITGGNSGSPVMNANGELIGLAFDGNWESMSSDVMFEPDLQRCINVDIRYVLFIMDKFGGAGYLLNEMDIVK